jgi:hypothetical protein
VTLTPVKAVTAVPLSVPELVLVCTGVAPDFGVVPALNFIYLTV